jgi:hypothetical protein
LFQNRLFELNKPPIVWYYSTIILTIVALVALAFSACRSPTGGNKFRFKSLWQKCIPEDFIGVLSGEKPRASPGIFSPATPQVVY